MLLSLKDYLTDDTENKIILIKIISDRISVHYTEEEHNMLWKDRTIGNGIQHNSAKCRGMTLKILTRTKI